MKNINNKKQGFTLIELLVVIAIIGMLAATVLVSLATARSKGRDAKRIADLKNLELALQLYADSNKGAVPANIAALVTGGFLPEEPKDPNTEESYEYARCGKVGTSDKYLKYELGANLENDTSVHQSDADISADNAATKLGTCDTAAPYFVGADATACGGTDTTLHCYDLIN